MIKYIVTIVSIAKLVRTNKVSNAWHKDYEPFFNMLDKRLDYIIDVGAGDGAYGKYLRRYADKVIAVEKFRPYCLLLKLNKNYDEVHCVDAVDFDYSKYNPENSGIIASHVIEHMPKEKGLEFLDKIKDFKFIFLAFPVNPFHPLSQSYGSLFGTEPHQSSYTPEEMMDYGFRCFITNDKPPVYICVRLKK